MRLHRALAAAALTLGLLATSVPAAQAAPADATPFDYSACEFSDGQLFSTDLAVGVTHSLSVDITVRSSNCGTFDDFETSYPYPYLDFGSNVGTYIYPTSSNASLAGPVTADPSHLDNSIAGKKLTGNIRLPDGTSRPFPGPELVLKLKATYGETGAPSKVKKNKSFSVYAVLLRANWNEGFYVPYRTKTLKLQSRPSGEQWKTIKTLDTGKGGREGGGVDYKTKIKKNTCFRWVFEGSSTTSAATSGSDCVKIKK